MIEQTTGGIGANPTITLTGGGGADAVAAVRMGVTSTTFTINGGTTVYSVAPTVTIAGGGATVAALGSAILTNGIVTGITITHAGSGYVSSPSMSFTAGTVTTAGTNPTGTGNAANFIPVSYAITTTGTGYTSAPTVNFSRGPLAATATLSGIVLEGNSSIGGTGDIRVDGLVSEEGGARALTKVGTNVLTLTNAGNTYSGGTLVNAGTLMAISAAGSVTGGGTVTATGGTLAGHHSGTGGIAGPVTIATGGTISPGSDTALIGFGTGTLKTASLDLQTGGVARLSIEGLADFDRLLVSGNDGLVLNGRIVVSTGLTGAAFDTAFAEGASFDLLDWAGLLGGSFAVGTNFRDGSGDAASQFDLPDISSLGRGWDVSQFLINGSIFVSLVPEPSRALLVGTGMMLVIGGRRRKTI